MCSAGGGWDMAGSSHGAGQTAPLSETDELLLLWLPTMSNGTRILWGGWWGRFTTTERTFPLLLLLLSTTHKQVPAYTFS